ncbi:MAG TPA: GNAT family protein [Pseudonocardiaceae bacterium]|nr:GNAT family protein [Pseudonocardiaceae bacterium]
MTVRTHAGRRLPGEEVVAVALWRLHVQVTDQPGQLGELAAALGGAGANILSLHVIGERSDTGAVTDELLLELPAAVPVTALVAAAEGRGFRCTVVVRADAQALVDPVTTALALARCVVTDPPSASRAVATLLGAELVDGSVDDRDARPAHVAEVGSVRLGRGWPLTAIERSRAVALLELAGTRGTGPAPTPTDPRVLLTDGSQVVLRHATAADEPLVAALHARCSPHTRALRMLTSSPRLAPAELHALLTADGPGSAAVLALTADGGSATGLANLRPAGDGSAEIGLLVEDSWQGRGVGTALTRRLVELALDGGLEEFTAVVPGDNQRITRLLRRAGLRPQARMADGMLHVRAGLTGTPTPWTG